MRLFTWDYKQTIPIYTGALSIVHMTGTLWAVTSCIIVFGFSLFLLLTHVGSKLLAKYERQEQNTTTKIGEIA